VDFGVQMIILLIILT